MCYRAYNGPSEELSPEAVEEPQEAVVQQHHPQHLMSPNNQRNLLKMLK